MKTGFDTGFFVELLKGNSKAVEAWRRVVNGECEACVSCLTFFELYRLAFKGKLEVGMAEEVVKAIRDASETAWITSPEICERAARISSGTGIPSIDALILTSLMECGAEEIYTTDSHMALYRAKGTRIILV